MCQWMGDGRMLESSGLYRSIGQRNIIPDHAISLERSNKNPLVTVGDILSLDVFSTTVF